MMMQSYEIIFTFPKKYLAIFSRNLQELVKVTKDFIPLHCKRDTKGSAQAQSETRAKRIFNNLLSTI
jgi:hypothetical protein